MRFINLSVLFREDVLLWATGSSSPPGPLGHAEQECGDSLPWPDGRARLGMTRDSAYPPSCGARHEGRYTKIPFKEPWLRELVRVIKASACIEASFKRDKGEEGMDEYQVCTWHGWHHHMALSLISVWFLIGDPPGSAVDTSLDAAASVLRTGSAPAGGLLHARRGQHLSPSATAITAQRGSPFLPSLHP